MVESGRCSGGSFTRRGGDSLEELARCSPEELFERLHAVNDEKRYTTAMASLKDVRHCVATARELPEVIEY